VIEATPAPEEWRPITGHEGAYEVSDLGRVRSLDRIVIARSPHGGTHLRHHRGRILRPVKDGHGYSLVRLGKLGDIDQRLIHQLVLEAFVSARPPGLDACHGPGGCQDNRAANLSWGTRSQNNGADRWRDGTALTGEHAPMAKLTWTDVDEIRRRYFAATCPPGIHRGPSRFAATAETTKHLAAAFGVHQTTIARIVAGKTWHPEARRHAS
jgi:hypothetical protein